MLNWLSMFIRLINGKSVVSAPISQTPMVPKYSSSSRICRESWVAIWNTAAAPSMDTTARFTEIFTFRLRSRGVVRKVTSCSPTSRSSKLLW
ncbi:hypothetical protein D3C76_1267290 [compost metagenome]